MPNPIVIHDVNLSPMTVFAAEAEAPPATPALGKLNRWQKRAIERQQAAIAAKNRVIENRRLAQQAAKNAQDAQARALGLADEADRRARNVAIRVAAKDAAEQAVRVAQRLALEAGVEAAKEAGLAKQAAADAMTAANEAVVFAGKAREMADRAMGEAKRCVEAVPAVPV